MHPLFSLLLQRRARRNCLLLKRQLLLTALFNVWGFALGSICILILLLTNATVNGTRSYLYPLLPFNGRALRSLFVRVRKDHGKNRKGKTTGKGA